MVVKKEDPKHPEKDPKKIYIDPCPFCAEVQKIGLLWTADKGMVFWIYCKSCQCSGPVAETEQIAAERWNARKPLTL